MEWKQTAVAVCGCFSGKQSGFYIVFGYAGINHCVLLKCVLIFIFKQAVL